MPMEWLTILQSEKPLATYYQLEYELTVVDVYNILEIMEVDKFYSLEMQRIEESMRK